MGSLVLLLGLESCCDWCVEYFVLRSDYMFLPYWQHWQHLCECKYSKRRLRYRYTLAELYDLIAIIDRCGIGETSESKDLRRTGLCFTERCTLKKKVGMFVYFIFINCYVIVNALGDMVLVSFFLHSPLSSSCVRFWCFSNLITFFLNMATLNTIHCIFSYWG